VIEVGFFDDPFNKDETYAEQELSYCEGFQDGLYGLSNPDKMDSGAYRDGFYNGDDEFYWESFGDGW
jgi:hypothetical protein